MSTSPKCPKCGSQEWNKARNPRYLAPGNVMVRHKTCKDCGYTYETVESPVDDEGGALVIDTLGDAWAKYLATKALRERSIRLRHSTADTAE